MAEEVKITKEKIKEVEEEWQNNLLSWKSKRRQSNNSSEGKLSQCHLDQQVPGSLSSTRFIGAHSGLLVLIRHDQ